AILAARSHGTPLTAPDTVSAAARAAASAAPATRWLTTAPAAIAHRPTATDAANPATAVASTVPGTIHHPPASAQLAADSGGSAGNPAGAVATTHTRSSRCATDAAPPVTARSTTARAEETGSP